MDEAEQALRRGDLARAHVLTRALPLGEAPRASVVDNGPGYLDFAWRDPEAARKLDRNAVLTPFAAAAALQWDPREAAAIVAAHGRLNALDRVDKSAAYVAFQAFRLWNTPFARAATPESLAPFLDLLGTAARRAADRALYLRLRALSLPCQPPDPVPAPTGIPDDFSAAMDVPDFPSRDPDRAERLTRNRDLLPFILGCWDPAWVRARWTSREPHLARVLFERLLPDVDTELLELARPQWSGWAEAIRALARFHPAIAHKEAEKAPESHYVGTRARVFEGEADGKTFEIRLDLLRRVSGDGPATRAALWLLLEEPPPWPDEARLRAAVDAAGATLAAEPEYLAALLSTHRRLGPAGT